MTLIFRVVLLCLVSAAGIAAESPDPAQLAEAFLTQLGKNESDAACDTLFAGSGMAELKPQAITAMKSQVKVALGMYGKMIGFEKIGETAFSPSLKRMTYLQKFEQYPVIWEMYFYRNKNQWVVNQIFFNDQPAAVLTARP
jgi:hypothetical protein